ncbi:rod shape-determining protein [Candidatus Nomurabacteria bacterium]|nr:rod shape-determining protein [Candidatus Nomurabacteria bacterium]
MLKVGNLINLEQVKNSLSTNLQSFRGMISSKNPDIFLGLDIGTEQVKAVLAKYIPDNGKLEVIATGQAKQGLSDMQSGTITDISGVITNCDQAIREAESKSDQIAKRVVIGIAGELVQGNSFELRYQRKDPEIEIGKLETQDVLSKLQAKGLDKAREDISWETGQKNLDIRLLNSAITQIIIDGYQITNPIGFKGEHVTLRAFNAFAPMIHIAAVETIAKNLDLSLVAIAAEPFAIAKSVQELGKEATSAVFIDIGGGTTDIAIVSEGGVAGTKMFALGGRSFTRALANIFSLSFDRAEELKLAYSEGRLSPDKTKKVKKALSSVVELWLEGVKLSLEEFENLDQLPNRILLCGGGSKLADLTTVLDDKAWHKEVGFSRSPVIKHIKKAQIPRVNDPLDLAKGPEYITPLALLSLSLDTVTSDPNSNILSRFNQVIKK